MSVLKMCLACISFLTCAVSYAQNVFPNQGNVGIGTSQPSLSLEVNGGSTNFAASRVTSSGWDAALSFNNTGDGGREYWWDSGSGQAGVGQGNFTVWDNTAQAARLSIDKNGNIGIGTIYPGAKLEVQGNILLTSGSGASITFADGTIQSTAWNGTACGGDYAESIDVSGDRTVYQPGDLLVIDPDNPERFLRSNEAYSSLVAGIYSTKPGFIGRRQTTLQTSSEVPMAMVGIVPAKVTAENGPIHVGDLLVASSLLGHAMKGTDRSRMMGAVVGKALGSLDSGTGVIQVLVSLQ